MENKFTKYTFTQRHGMEGIGDMELEWLTPQEINQRRKEYREYREKCKQEGIYGQEYNLVIEMEHDPVLDYKVVSDKSLVSFSSTIIDFTDERN